MATTTSERGNGKTAVVKNVKLIQSPGGQPQLNIELGALSAKPIFESRNDKNLESKNASSKEITEKNEYIAEEHSLQNCKADMASSDNPTSGANEQIAATHKVEDNEFTQNIPEVPEQIFDSDSEDSLEIPDNQTLLRKYGLLDEDEKRSNTRTEQRGQWVDLFHEEETSSLDSSPPHTPTPQTKEIHNSLPSEQDTHHIVQSPKKVPSFEQVFGEGFEQTKSANEELIAALDEKDRQLEAMAAKLIAAKVELPSTVQTENLDPTVVDPRDQKIVQMARKSRSLHQALGKERGKVAVLEKKLKEAESKIVVLSGAHLPGTKNALMQRVSDIPTDSSRETAPTSAPKEKGRSAKEWSARLETLRARMDQTTLENRRLKQVLTKEVGEGKILNKLLRACSHAGNTSKTKESEQDVKNLLKTWKGRAEQLVVLNSKLQRTRDELAKYKQQAGLVTPRKSRPTIDDRAAEDIRELERERRESVDRIARDNQELDEYCTKLKQKVQASKARITTLESEKKKFKTNLKLLVTKSTNDDELIKAQREEMQNLMQQVEKMDTQLKTTKDSSQSIRKSHHEVVQQLNHQSGENGRLENLVKHLRTEITSLRKQLSQERNSMSNMEMKGKVREAKDELIRVENERLAELVKILKSTQDKLQNENAELLQRCRLSERREKSKRIEGNVAQGQEPQNMKRHVSKIPSRGRKRSSIAPHEVDTRIPSATGVIQNIQALKEALQFEIDENMALKASAKEALAAKDAEIGILKKTLAETKQAYTTALRELEPTQNHLT